MGCSQSTTGSPSGTPPCRGETLCEVSPSQTQSGTSAAAANADVASNSPKHEWEVRWCDDIVTAGQTHDPFTGVDPETSKPRGSQTPQTPRSVSRSPAYYKEDVDYRLNTDGEDDITNFSAGGYHYDITTLWKKLGFWEDAFRNLKMESLHKLRRLPIKHVWVKQTDGRTKLMTGIRSDVLWSQRYWHRMACNFYFEGAFYAQIANIAECKTMSGTRVKITGKHIAECLTDNSKTQIPTVTVADNNNFMLGSDIPVAKLFDIDGKCNLYGPVENDEEVKGQIFKHGALYYSRLWGRGGNESIKFMSYTEALKKWKDQAPNIPDECKSPDGQYVYLYRVDKEICDKAWTFRPKRDRGRRPRTPLEKIICDKNGNVLVIEDEGGDTMTDDEGPVQTEPVPEYYKLLKRDLNKYTFKKVEVFEPSKSKTDDELTSSNEDEKPRSPGPKVSEWHLRVISDSLAAES